MGGTHHEHGHRKGRGYESLGRLGVKGFSTKMFEEESGVIAQEIGPKIPTFQRRYILRVSFSIGAARPCHLKSDMRNTVRPQVSPQNCKQQRQRLPFRELICSP